jgi:hypothetical protein
MSEFVLDRNRPIEVQFDQWSKDKHHHIGRRGELVYCHHNNCRTRSGWVNTWQRARRHKKNVGHTAREQLKDHALKLYGEKCAHCGFSHRDALQFDHVNGGGRADRNSFSSPTAFYQHVIDEHESGKFQILCANCNIIKRKRCGEFGKARF